MKDRYSNFLLLISSCVLALFLLNVCLALFEEFKPSPMEADLRERAANAKKNGVHFDSRLPRQVISDLRAQGRDIIPLSFPYQHFAGIDVEGRRVVPLSGISNATSVNSNECDEYPVYMTDELGFNNPRGTQGEKSFDVALIGDSFAFGFSVDPKDGIPARLREYGLSCINYGHGGNGPLVELATLTEYALSKKIQDYVWLYYGGNDLDDLQREMQVGVLQQYLHQPDFRQGLQSLVPQIDQVLRAKAEEGLKGPPRDYRKLALDLLLLRHVRGRLGLSVHRPDPLRYETAAVLLTTVIQEAKRRVEKNGGHLLVVYLPAEEFVHKEYPKYMLALRAIRESGADLLDLTPVFLQSGDPLSNFPFRMLGHYAPEGYALVARSIFERLQQEDSRLSRVPRPSPGGKH